jgi:hypothetical protein
MVSSASSQSSIYILLLLCKNSVTQVYVVAFQAFLQIVKNQLATHFKTPMASTTLLSILTLVSYTLPIIWGD